MDEVAQAQSIPVSFLENILTQLRSSGIVRSQRGPEGGYWLAHPAEEVNLAQIIRAVEGPLVGVRGQRPEEVEYAGSAESLQQVWIALRANLRKVLENVTVADVAAGQAAQGGARAHARGAGLADALAICAKARVAPAAIRRERHVLRALDCSRIETWPSHIGFMM